MTADSDGNGKPDSYRLYSVTLPPSLPPGTYFAFAALAEPGSAQAGAPQLIGPISLSYFAFAH
jgi:hypothetical protein